MCLNYTVYPQPIVGSPERPLTEYTDPYTKQHDQPDNDDQNSRIGPIEDEPSRPIGIADPISQSNLDLSITQTGYQSHPQVTAKTSSFPAPSSFLLGAISMVLILVVVIISLVRYRRSMSVWFYSRSGLNMFSAHTKPSHHHHAVGSLGKHSALHHPHLHHHHHHSQYGASSSAGSTSSSSAASSNLSQALCQQQQQSTAAAAASGLVTTPLIVTNSNNNNSHQLLNSTATTTTTAASAAAASSLCNDDEKLFDAYLTYSRADEQFINDNIAPELEYGQPSYR